MKYPLMEYGMGIEIDRATLEADDFFMHEFNGKHKDFNGRPYRRGKNRCHYCGAILIENEKAISQTNQ